MPGGNQFHPQNIGKGLALRQAVTRDERITQNHQPWSVVAICAICAFCAIREGREADQKQWRDQQHDQ
jgi:hypothetical protein